MRRERMYKWTIGAALCLVLTLTLLIMAGAGPAGGGDEAGKSGKSSKAGAVTGELQQDNEDNETGSSDRQNGSGEAHESGGLRSSLRDAANVVMKPVSAVFSGIQEGMNGLFRFKAVVRENEQLAAEKQRLEQENRQLRLKREELAELQELSEAFQYEGMADEQIVAARITAMDASHWDGFFTIDKGTADGVKAGAAVVCGSGLAGRVNTAGKHSAIVASLRAEGAKVSFYVRGRSGQMGVIESNGKGGLTGYLFAASPEGETEEEENKENRPAASAETAEASAADDGESGNTAGIRKGDRLITSGVGIYPKGLDLGTVVQVEKKKTARQVVFKAEPAVRAQSQTMVGVIK